MNVGDQVIGIAGTSWEGTIGTVTCDHRYGDYRYHNLVLNYVPRSIEFGFQVGNEITSNVMFWERYMP